MTTLTRLAGAICAASVLATAAQSGEVLTPREHTVYSATCRYYEDRLAKADPAGKVVLVKELAQSCDAALMSLEDARRAPLTEKEAVAYLARLAEFKATIVTMNMRRLFGGEKRTVSATGEYLIAQRMGLLDAYRAWTAGTSVPVAGAD